MNKIFNLVSTFKAKELTNGNIRIRGMASTPDIDRAGDVIIPDAWKKGGLDNFKNNPIILFNHNGNKPIGRATKFGVSDEGLALEAEISKAASDNVHGLIKDGVLGTFSVGFMIKDADYIEETNGLKIKEAELFEVSVVSIPMNQAATFSLAKSFDSMEEYRDFTKTFTNRVDLAGQSLASTEINVSDTASHTSEGVPNSTHMEIKMSGENTTPQVDLEALALKVAEQTAAKFAMKQAKEKAAEDAAIEQAKDEQAARETAAAAVTSAVEAGLSGAEKMVKDLEEALNKKDADMQETLAKFKTEFDEKAKEIEDLRNSKRVFSDRGGNTAEAIKENSTELMYAHLLGVMTGKGWETDYSKGIMEKAGMDYTTDTTLGDLDQEVQDRIQKEVTVHTKVANVFREIPVNGRATVLPVQTDTNLATWAINTGSSPGTSLLENRDNATSETYKARSVTLLVDRLISSTWMDNDIDEKTLVNLMPMLTDGIVRAHARAVEQAILRGDGTTANLPHIDDFTAVATAASTPFSLADIDTPAADLLAARADMGKYGLFPEDLIYIVNQDVYYALIQDAEFANLNEVGAMATKLKGAVGSIYGTPVLVSDEFVASAVGTVGAFVINKANYVLPRLRGIKVEQDYEVLEQRRVLVATQSLGFTELFAGTSGIEPSIAVEFAT